jgi:hypothetical protein
MAVTTEPGLRVARSKDITLEDYQDAIDRIEPAATPLFSLCRTERKLSAIDRTWNVDSFAGPKGAVGRADNEAAPVASAAGTRDAATNIRKIGNVAQAFSETWGRGWLADVPKIAGVNDIDAYGKAAATELLKQHSEVAMESFDQVAVYDQGSGLGAVMAGYRKLTDNANAYSAASAYAIGKPSDIHYAPTAACVTGGMTSAHNRAMWKTVALALRTATKRRGDYLVITGLTLRQAVTDLTIPTTVTVTSTASTAIQQNAADQVRVYLRNESDNVLGATVDVIQTDFGRFMITDSDYIGTTTTDSSGSALSAVNTTSGTGAGARGNAAFVSSPKNAIILQKGNAFKAWAKMPVTELMGLDGSGQRYDTKCSLTFGLDNPIRAGWCLFT